VLLARGVYNHDGLCDNGGLNDNSGRGHFELVASLATCSVWRTDLDLRATYDFNFFNTSHRSIYLKTNHRNDRRPTHYQVLH
jgi:hypothetical protein